MTSSPPPREYLLKIKVTPNASRNEIGGWMPDAVLKIRIQSPAQDGKANKALIAFLAELTGVSKNRIALRSGAASRQKVIAFENLSATEWQRLPRP